MSDLNKTPFLVVKRGPHCEETRPLENAIFTIGRAETNDLYLIAENVSRAHARIVTADDGVYVVDLGSSNGTWVNGIRIKKQRIVTGDEIVIGSTTIRFLTEESASIPAPVEKPAAPRRNLRPVVEPRPKIQKRLAHATYFLLLSVLFAMIVITDFSWERGVSVGDYWGDRFFRKSSPEPQRKKEDVVRVPNSSNAQSPLATSHLPPATEEDIPPSDLRTLAQRAFQNLVKDVRDALAVGEFEKADLLVSSFRKSLMSGGFALEIFNLEHSISLARREHAAREQEATARREARFKEVESKVQQAVAAEDFDGAKETASALTDDPRAQSLVALVEKAREEHIARRLPQRRASFEELAIILRPLTRQREYGKALEKLRTLDRDPRFKDHGPMLIRERKSLEEVAALYREIVGAIVGIAENTPVEIALKNGRVWKGKYRRIEDRILWLIGVKDGDVFLPEAGLPAEARARPAIFMAEAGVPLADIAMKGLVTLALSVPNPPNALILRGTGDPAGRPYIIANLYLYDEDFASAAMTSVGETEGNLDAVLDFFAKVEMTRKAFLDADIADLSSRIDTLLAKGDAGKAVKVWEEFKKTHAPPVPAEIPAPESFSREHPRMTEIVAKIDKAHANMLVGNMPYHKLKVLEEQGKIDEKSTLLRALKVTGDAKTVPYIVKALEDSSAQVRLEAVRALAVIGSPKDSWPLVRMLDDPVTDVGFAAIDGVKRLGITPQSLQEGFKTGDAGDRRSAAVVAGILDDEHMTGMLRSALADPDWQVRKASAMSLAKLKDKGSGGALVNALKTETDPGVVAAIAFALGEIHHQSGVSILAEILRKNPSHPFKQEIIRAIAQIGGSGVEKALTHFLKDLDPWTRQYAIAGLAKNRVKVDAKDVGHLLADDLWLNRAGVVKALAAGEEDRSLETIVMALEDAHPAVRATAHHALASWKKVAVIPAIVKRLDDLNGEGKTLAVDILKLLTKQTLDDKKAWENWWGRNGGAFRLPSIDERFKPPETKRR